MRPVIAEIADLRRLHRRRTPRMFYDYVESGSWAEQTFAENGSDFRKLYLRQRVAVDLSDRTLACEFGGREASMPVAVAPVGLLGMQHPDGEILVAQAAEKTGIPFTLSTMSICSIEDIAAHTQAPFWFQLYVMRDEAFVDALIGRAEAAGCDALVLTLDLQVLGQRHKDLRNGLSTPMRLTPSTMLDLASKWGWAMGMARTRRRGFGNVQGHVEGVSDTRSLMAWVADQFDPKLDWTKVRRIRDRWKGRLIMKGVLDAEDAWRAVDAGADGVIVSNHGGRQLDGALSSIRALPGVVEAVGNATEVFLDSGVRSGQDVLKAVALGARAVFVGRAIAYGLGADGERGVAQALEIIRKELDLSMALCGRRAITDIGLDILLAEPSFAPPKPIELGAPRSDVEQFQSIRSGAESTIDIPPSGGSP